MQNTFKLIAAGLFHPGGLHGFSTGSLSLYTPKEPNFSMKSAHQSPKKQMLTGRKAAEGTSTSEVPQLINSHSTPT